MGIHILAGECEGRGAACLVDSVTGTVFGPVFRSYEDADGFVAWSRESHRLLTDWIAYDGDLTRLHTRWLAQPDCCACLEERAVANGRCVECGPDAAMAEAPAQEDRP
jgi:hypothetical protein